MDGGKRTASDAGFEQSNQPPKRLCLRTPAELSELPIRVLIEKAYVDDDCRDFLIERIYHKFICPDLLNINLKNLLRLDTIKIAIETLTPFELHLICTRNPDNILRTDAGRDLITNLHNKAQHDPSAQNTLAFLYKEGLPGILEQNLDIALELLTKASNEGFATAQCNLGDMYDTGRGIPKDYAKAVEWYIKAAIQGHASAQFCLGLTYDFGRGIPKDYAKAAAWYTIAAIQGFASAQNNLGYMYYMGIGVPQDYAMFVIWCTKAANQGKGTARDAITKVLSKRNDPLLINPVDINALSLKMTTEIENFNFALNVALGETILGEEKNNPTGSQNTQGNNPGMAIPSLYSDFQCCPEYALKIRNILNHLISKESMDKGFLITTLQLNPDHKNFGVIYKQLANSEICLRLTQNPTNSLSYLSFGDTSSDYNFKYSILFQDILDERNPEYLKMKEALKSLEEIYELNLRENKSKALTIQYSSFTNRESLENAQNEIKLLNEIIEKNKVMLFSLKTLNGCREKLIEIIEESTPLRNLAFSKNPFMKHF